MTFEEINATTFVETTSGMICSIRGGTYNEENKTWLVRDLLDMRTTTIKKEHVLKIVEREELDSFLVYVDKNKRYTVREKHPRVTEEKGIWIYR